MLERVGYNGNDIIHKNVMDNSCGNGAFLCEVVKRYIEVCVSLQMDNETIKEELETYIHGLEIDYKAYCECIDNLDEVCVKYGISNVGWDVINGDTLYVTRFNGQMDYVVGNPPYCNVHDMKDKYDKVKEYSFAQGGMTDLYLVFFEIGLNMLNEDGKLVYITPSSWTNSMAGRVFRNECVKNGYIKELIDLQHHMVFDNATTFTMVTYLTHSPNDMFRILHMYEGNIVLTISECYADNRMVDGKLYVCNDELFNFFKHVNSIKKRRFFVKNGFATLNDKFFLEDEDCTMKNTIPVLKASKNVMQRMFFPYNENGKPLKDVEIDEETMSYMKGKAETMGVDTNDKGWYLYGRTQAINDVYSTKFTVNNIIRDCNDIKVNEASKGTGIYSGFYILDTKGEATLEWFEKVLKTEFFTNYVKAVGKYKNGGYYTFNTKELEKFLNYADDYIGFLK